MFSGYADFEAYGLLGEDDAGDSTSDIYFDNHHFNLIGLGSIYGDLFVASEVEYEHSGDEINLEYGYIGYTGFKDLRIMAGKFIVPFGRFNKDLHASWINKMVDRPYGFERILPQTYSDAGIWVSGARAMNDGSRITYDVFVINGLMGDDGADIRGMRGNGREKQADGEIDSNKALGGRLGIDVAPKGFDFGASVYSGNYSNSDTETLNLLLLGVDAAYRNSGLEARAEFIKATQEVSAGADLDKTGGYVQLAYRLPSNFEPVARYSMRDFPGDSKRDNSRLSFGLNYYISPASSVRLNYHINQEAHSEFEKTDNKVVLQFNVNF